MLLKIVVVVEFMLSPLRIGFPNFRWLYNSRAQSVIVPEVYFNGWRLFPPRQIPASINRNTNWYVGNEKQTNNEQSDIHNAKMMCV
jgi:hypothetical protein